MTRPRRLFRIGSARSGDLRRETEEEIETHLALRTEDLVAAGMEPGQAREEAERRFGEVRRERRRLYRSARRRNRRLRWTGLVVDTVSDIRLVGRQALRYPSHTTASLGIYALAIGLATSMFAVFDHVLLRPLPYPEPDRLVSLQSVAESGTPFGQVSMANWVDWRGGARSLASTGLYRTGRVSATVGGEALRATAAGVSGDFFRTVRPTFVAGHAFSDEDGQRGEAVAVISSAFARRRLGTPEAAVGSTFEVSGRPYQVVGVVDAGSSFPERVEIWTPERWQPGSGGMRNNINYQSIARLAEGATIRVVRSELDAVAAGIREGDPEAAYSWGVGVLPLRDVLVEDARPYLGMLMAAVLGVLLTACANLAGLALARARHAEREVTLRLALGCGRGRLVRQLLTTHATMAAIGGLIGMLGAAVATGWLSELARVTIPRADTIAVDLRVATFALVLSLLAGLFAGGLPTVRAASLDPGHGLANSRRVVRGGRGASGQVLVVAEVALALTMLIGGGLLLRSFSAVLGRDLGYDPRGVVTADIALVGADYQDEESRLAYWSTLLESLRRAPGVRDVGIGNWIPTGGSGTGFIALPDEADPDFGAGYRVVSEDYFDAMGMRLVAGRGFGGRDVREGVRVTVVNEALADRAWPGRSAVGQRIRAESMESWLYDGEAPWLTVVGVVGDVRHRGFEADPSLEMYVLHRQVPAWTASMTAVARAVPGGVGAVSEEVRTRVSRLDPSLAVEIGSLDRRVLDLLTERRMILSITMGFAAATLLLACLGVYGLVAFSTALRSREMAIRSALGARQAGLLGVVMGSAARVVGVGALLGWLVAASLTGLIRDLLVDVPPLDPVTFAGCAALLITVGLAAALLPALRASRADPASVLAEE